METKAAESSPEKSARERGLRVVAIGGGTGLSTLLTGLKRFVSGPRKFRPNLTLRSFETCAQWLPSATMVAPAGVCVKNSTCCRRATFATALLL